MNKSSLEVRRPNGRWDWAPSHGPESVNPKLISLFVGARRHARWGHDGQRRLCTPHRPIEGLEPALSFVSPVCRGCGGPGTRRSFSFERRVVTKSSLQRKRPSCPHLCSLLAHGDTRGGDMMDSAGCAHPIGRSKAPSRRWPSCARSCRGCGGPGTRRSFSFERRAVTMTPLQRKRPSCPHLSSLLAHGDTRGGDMMDSAGYAPPIGPSKASSRRWPSCPRFAEGAVDRGHEGRFRSAAAP
jgi:hypothetical protein